MSVISGYEYITAMVDGDQVSSALFGTKALSQYLKMGTSSVSPDWTTAANQPVIYVRAKSQLQGIRKPIVAGTELWFYNGTLMVFNSSGISTTPAGLFQKTTYDDGGVSVPALKIIGNLASVTNTDNDVIEFSGAVQLGTVQTTIAPGISIRLEETTGDPYEGYIDATEGGVIDDDTAQTILTAILLKGGAEVSSGITYKWYVSGASWTAISSDANKPHQKTFTASDIDSELLVRCDFLIDGVVVYSITRQISDETDPLIISSNPSGSNTLKTGESITFTPTVVRRSDGAVQSGYAFAFALYNKSDVKIKDASGASITITRSDVDAASGGIRLYISASKS